MTPDENFAFINAYLERMGPVIRDHNGFIDKYIGDAIMALFESADDALARRPRHARYARRPSMPSAAPPASRRSRIGIGINTGSLMLGTIGEKHRMDGTVISDAVNLASRIESLTKTYGVGAPDLAEHLWSSSGRSQGLRHPSDRRGGGQGQDPAGHHLRGLPARPGRPSAPPRRRTRDLLQSGVEALARRTWSAPAGSSRSPCRSCPATWRPATSCSSAADRP